MKYLKYLLFLCVFVYAECPLIITKELLLQLYEYYGYCKFKTIEDIDICKTKEGAYDNSVWKYEIIVDSLGGFAVFSDSYVYVQKNVYIKRYVSGNSIYFFEDGTLIGEHFCFDRNGLYEYNMQNVKEEAWYLLRTYELLNETTKIWKK